MNIDEFENFLQIRGFVFVKEITAPPSHGGAIARFYARKSFIVGVSLNGDGDIHISVSHKFKPKNNKALELIKKLGLVTFPIDITNTACHFKVLANKVH